MIKKWKLPSPPVFAGDEEKTSRAQALFQLQVTLVVLGLAIVPVALFNPAQRIIVLATALFTNAASLLSYFLTRKGRLNAAAYIVLFSVTAALIYLDYTGRGQTRPLLIFSIIPIFVAGWVLGARATIGAAVVMAISHGIFVYMDAQDLYSFEATPIPDIQRIFVVGLGYVTTAILFQLALRRIQILLQQARISEQAARQNSLLLEEAQSELQAYIARLENTAQELQRQSEALTQQARELEEANLVNRRRALEFQAVAEISRAITELRELNELLPSIAQTVSAKLGHYHVGIFLLDPQGEYAILAASNSEGGQRMLQRGHRLEVGKKGIVGYVAAAGIPRVALDVGQDAVYFDNPDLPNTRSEIALPMIAEGRIIGVLDVQSTQPNAFGQQDIEILSTLAAQIGAAIENARRFEQTQKALLEAQTIYRQEMESGWKRLARRRKLTGFRYDNLKITAIEPIDSQTAEQIAAQKIVLETNEQASRLSLPIVIREQVIGVLEVQSNGGRSWSKDEVDIAQAVAERVALAAENARLFAQTTERAEQERKVSEITSKIRSTNDPDEMIQIAINELKQALSVKNVRILPYQPAEQQKG
ncbi:MAG: GAF domain-containing protein [Anaerolineales bacterium]|nr:GAF domain-containing protein [Anaerolineales bacterium]MDW8278850.1 GAF domain-containing protein [Anaerolineales bacterium]